MLALLISLFMFYQMQLSNTTLEVNLIDEYYALGCLLQIALSDDVKRKLVFGFQGKTICHGNCDCSNLNGCYYHLPYNGLT